jgi:nitroreductase
MSEEKKVNEEKKGFFVKLNSLLQRLGLELKRTKLIINILYDARRYVQFSALIPKKKTSKAIISNLYLMVHVLEKRLQFGFDGNGHGKNIVISLLDDLEKNKNIYKNEKNIVISAYDSIFEYCKLLTKSGIENSTINERLKNIKLIFAYVEKTNREKLGGTSEKNRESLVHKKNASFIEVVSTRSSLRQFTDGSVSIDIIKDAIKLGQKSPSSCNRQSTRVYLIQNKEIMREILAKQGGNRGFGHKIDKLLIFTADLSHYMGVGERNMCYVDGGMFIMTVVHALQASNIATCALHWGVNFHKEKQLHKKADIPMNERVLLILAIGYAPDKYRITKSLRKNIEEVFITRS